MKIVFFDTHNDRQFNRASWAIFFICAVLAFICLFSGVFSDFRWTILLAYLILLPGLIMREWYNYEHNGFAFVLMMLFFVGATLYILFAWTGFLNH